MNLTESRSKLESISCTLKERIHRGVWSVGDQIPTEIELAAEFECSRSTVSKAIAQLVQAGLVERKTKSGTRVLRNSEATAKAEIELNAFAFIYPNDQHDTIWHMLKGFQAASREAKRRTVLLASGGDCKKEAELISHLQEFDVKGAVVFPLIPSPEDAIHFSRILSACQLPIVLLDTSVPPLNCPSVTPDEFHSGYAMGRYVIKQGAKRIGFIANASHMPTVRDKYRGFLWALDEAGIALSERNLLLDPCMRPDFEKPLSESISLGKRLFEKAGQMDAIVCANDYLALGCIHAAREHGLRVPADLTVVSCNDYGLLTPDGQKITGYRMPHEELGHRSFEILDRIVNGMELSVTETVIRGEIVPGNTCKQRASTPAP